MKKIVVILFGCFLFVGCGQNTQRENIYSNDSKCSGWEEYVGLVEKADGWVHVLEIIYYCDGEINHSYDAYNIKYMGMNGYDIEYYYPNGTVVVEDSPMVTLSLNEEASEEIVVLGEYFNQKMYTEPITIDDLASLSFEHLDKATIVELFNKTITSERLTSFGPNLIAFFAIEEDDSSEPTVQMAHITPYANAMAVNIEIIYDETTHLSDLVKKRKATAKQKALHNNIQLIEKKMIEKNTYKIRDEFPNLTDEIYQRVFDLSERFYEGY